MTFARVALVLQHGDDDAPGAIGAALAEHGVATRVVRGDRGERVPSSLGEACALIAMGGAPAADEDDRYPFLAAERRLLRAAVDAGLPVLGVCLGAQLLAVATGGGVRRGAAREVGWTDVERTAPDPWLDALPARFTPFHWHDDAIDPPPGATVLARSARAVQAFRVGPRAYGLQFHLELDGAAIAAWSRDATSPIVGAGSGEAAHVAEQERLARALFGAWARDLAPR